MDSSRKRDRSIERLLRQSLKSPQNGGVTDSCLDAEALAALLDGGLSGVALEMAESHLGSCARCQSLVGRLARIDSPVPPAEPGHAAPGWLAWVVPLTAAAAGIAIWVAVPHLNGAQSPRATEIQNQTAELQPQQPTAPADSARAPANGHDGDLQVGAPVPDAAAKKQTGVANGFRREAPSSEADSLAKQSALSKSMASSASEPPSPAAPAAAAPPPAATAARAAAPAPTAAAARTAAAAPAASAAPSPPSGNLLDSLRSTARRAEVAAIEVTSPDPMVRWRIAGSTVQRSTDGGAAWQAQSTGTAAELTAGAAPLPLVCWVVGRGGVVLLSTDGSSWRRVAFPETTDLSAVRARDARTASVSTADGRTFSTTDAGVTWVPRPLQDF